MNRAKSKYFNTAAKMNDALLEILKEKAFEYITVSEICLKAGVNRSTFYLHYENMSDLLAETVENLFNRFLSYFPHAEIDRVSKQFSDIELSKLNYISPEYLHPYLTYIKENMHVFFTVLKHGNAFGIERTFERMLQYIFDPILSRFGYPAEDRKYVMIFYLRGINAIVLEWLKDGCVRSIEEMTQIIQECIFGLDKLHISSASG